MNVVIIWPWLGMGGCERWLIALASMMESVSRDLIDRPIVVTHVVVQHLIDSSTHAELSQYTTVIVEPNLTQSNKQIDAAVYNANVVIVGGTPDITRLVRKSRCPIVFVAHGACDLTRELVSNAHTTGKVTRFAAVSECVRDNFPRHVQTQTVVIENGAEIERTTPVIRRDIIRSALGIRRDQIAVAYIGRLNPDKRVEALGEAIACLPDKFVGLIAGNANPDSPALLHCQSLAPGRIRFAGRLSHVGDVLGAADIWFNCSPAEGFCLSRIEASFAGVPVVSTPTGDLPRLEQENGRLSWLVPIGASGEAIANRIAECMRHNRERSDIANRSRAVSQSKYTSAAMVGRWVMFLESLVNDSQSR